MSVGDHKHDHSHHSHGSAAHSSTVLPCISSQDSAQKEGAEKRYQSLKKALWLSWAVTFFYFLVELFGGFYTGSLALLGDAGHMFTDLGALSLSLFALWVSSNQVFTRSRSFGYYRAEILASFLNGIFLWILVFFLFKEAYLRLQEPEVVHGAGLTVIAGVGLIINLLSAYFLHHGGSHGNLNVRAAFLHVMMDALGSLGALLSGAVIWATGWQLVDPLITFFIGSLVLYSSWGLIQESVSILMAFSPKHIDVEGLYQDLLSVGGVSEISDLHLWTITSGAYSFSSHVLVKDSVNHHDVLASLERILFQKYQITHTTIQIETEGEKSKRSK